MSYNVSIDKDLCIGCGSCCIWAPKVFGMDDEMKCKVIDKNGSDYKTLLEAAKNCPVIAIIVNESETGKRVFP